MAVGNEDQQHSPIGSSPPEQKSQADDSANWQGYPNKALRESIHCPKRTWKRVNASTFLELFADKWHDQPEPSSASELQKVHVQADVAAKYPMRKFRSVPEAGYSEVFALIGADGSVVEAYVVCSTDTDFHAVALTAVRKSTYSPARVAGNPIASIVRRPYLFMPWNR
jgi:outer membrane biosynthesis protein TonB